MNAVEQFGHTAKSLRVDGEFVDNKIEAAIAGLGIRVQKSMPYEHSTNGLTERMNHTIADHLRAMLWARHPDCPYRWVLALAYFTLIWNATSVVSHGTSAHLRFYKRAWNFLDMPSLSWGIQVESKVDVAVKAADRTEPGFFIASDYFRGIIVLVGTGAKVVRRSYWTLAVQ